MGERKGVNKYYPPDYDPNKGGLNKFLGTHALRERARKLHLGILIIRFEMPYNIWCEGCENHIGTGVRYNAEKKKVGMYYTTPVYQFRMKCHLCDNHFEIRTDPANLDYEIISGARRQERRWDPSENDQVAPEDKAVGRKMAADAMFRLEHSAADKTKAGALDAVMKDLEDFQESRWADDFSANQALRQKFRASENAIKAQQQVDARYNLDVPLLPPSADDSRQASLLAITRKETAEASMSERRQVLDAASVFARLKPKRVSATAKKDIAMQSIQNIVAAGTHSFDTFRNDFAKDLNVSGVVIKKKRAAPSASAVVQGSVSVRNSSGKRQKESGILVKKRKVLPVAATSTHTDVDSGDVNGGSSVSSNLDNSYCDTVSDSSGSSSCKAAVVAHCREQQDNFILQNGTSGIEDNSNSQHKTNSLNPSSVTIDKSVYREDVSNQRSYQMTKLSGKIEVNDTENNKLKFEHQRGLCSDDSNDVTLHTTTPCCSSHPFTKIDYNVSEKLPLTSEDDSSCSCGTKQPNSLEKSETNSCSYTHSSGKFFSKPNEASSLETPACPPLSSLPQSDSSTLLVYKTLSCSERNSHPATKSASSASDLEQFSNHRSVKNAVTPSSGDDGNLRDGASVDESSGSMKSLAPSTALLNLVDYSGSDSDT